MIAQNKASKNQRDWPTLEQWNITGKVTTSDNK